MMEREQIMEYVQETPIIPRRIIQYSVPRQTITKPSPHVEILMAANTMQNIDSTQHPVIHDSWRNKEYSTQKCLGKMEEQRLSFEEHQNEQHQNTIPLIKRVNTFFRKKSSPRRNSVISTGDAKADGSSWIGKHVSKDVNLQEQPAIKNLDKNYQDGHEGNNKTCGLFSFEETPPVQVSKQNPVNSPSESASMTKNKPSSGSFISLGSSEAELNPLEPASSRSPAERKSLRPDDGQNDAAAQDSKITPIEERKKFLQMEQSRLIKEIVRLENILNNHRKREAYIIQDNSRKKSLERDNFIFTRAPCSTASGIPAFEFDDPLRDKWTALQSLENSFGGRFESITNLCPENELSTIKERNFQIAKINNLCSQVEESIKRRQDLETKLRVLSDDNDNELLFLMTENKRRQKSSAMIHFLSDITKEQSKRFTAEEQSFVNQNEVKPLISDLSEKINKLNSILEMKNTCIRMLSNQ
ncbi:YLR030W-like protein [Saccharomyces kudriavzevii IFO 1802]|uniref:YLR030W-like protein n=2 Tax=Saccharomyces kudriavzevii (strain ATCC MYA-4449 / AS 2.2408 / CBS 8840 / NBRC 1802 / NCYC 2889) TaxID=226230 RepID=J5PQJ2_SACK1|nr:YLR030W-like protein [Saccharomyces kudriavzevii IFO 1802]